MMAFSRCRGQGPENPKEGRKGGHLKDSQGRYLQLKEGRYLPNATEGRYPQLKEGRYLPNALAQDINLDNLSHSIGSSHDGAKSPSAIFNPVRRKLQVQDIS